MPDGPRKSEFDWHYRCVICGRTEEPWLAIWQCPACQGELENVGPDSGTQSGSSFRGLGLWKWAHLLPVDPPESGTILGEGDTPLVPVQVEDVTVHLKMDSQLPTGSFKDRGAAVLSWYLRQIGQRRIIVDSSGNAAAAMAAYAAATGLECTVFVPATASPGKLVQAEAAGATVVPVEGSRDDVAHAAQAEASRDDTASYASHNWHPVFAEGVKTWALEVVSAFDERAPDAVYVPTGGGSAFVGAWRGFGACGVMPRLIACQPEACAPVVRAWAEDRPIAPVEQGATIAEGTRIAMPSRPIQIQNAIWASHGRCVSVTDDELVDTLRMLWKQGIYAEPTGVLGITACRKDIRGGLVSRDDLIVAHVTGHGLKSTSLNQDILSA